MFLIPQLACVPLFIRISTGTIACGRKHHTIVQLESFRADCWRGHCDAVERLPGTIQTTSARLQSVCVRGTRRAVDPTTKTELFRIAQYLHPKRPKAGKKVAYLICIRHGYSHTKTSVQVTDDRLLRRCLFATSGSSYEYYNVDSLIDRTTRISV